MRPLKQWRYVGAYGPEVMACVGEVRIGPLRQRFWAVCEPGRPVVERTTLGRGGVSMAGSRALGSAGAVEVDLLGDEEGGVQPRHADEGWARTQAGGPGRGAGAGEGRAHGRDRP